MRRKINVMNIDPETFIKNMLENIKKNKKIKVNVTKEIERCVDCPFHGIDGGPSPVMMCFHPSATTLELAYIIHSPECNNGFPERCPLLKENETKDKRQNTMRTLLDVILDKVQVTKEDSRLTVKEAVLEEDSSAKCIKNKKTKGYSIKSGRVTLGKGSTRDYAWEDAILKLILSSF